MVRQIDGHNDGQTDEAANDFLDEWMERWMDESITTNGLITRMMDEWFAYINNLRKKPMDRCLENLEVFHSISFLSLHNPASVQLSYYLYSVNLQPMSS